MRVSLQWNRSAARTAVFIALRAAVRDIPFPPARLDRKSARAVEEIVNRASDLAKKRALRRNRRRPECLNPAFVDQFISERLILDHVFGRYQDRLMDADRVVIVIEDDPERIVY